MSVISRGARNAFRNGLRTSAVVLILAISIGLSLSMLVANTAVEGRINDLERQVGRTVLVNPAGVRGMEGGGEPLTAADLEKVSELPGVETASGFLRSTLQTEGSEQTNAMMRMKGAPIAGETTLKSSIAAGTLGKRFVGMDGTEITPPPLPVRVLGASGSADDTGKPFNVTDGRLLQDGDVDSAVVGKALAEANDLSVGSTFTAAGRTFTVVGIVDQGTEFENDIVIMPLGTVQALAELPDEVSVIVAQATSISQLQPVMDAIKEALGADNVDVTTTQQNIQDAIQSLKSVQNISIVGFVAALAAAAIIVLMVMFVIVRERRREIGVLKAIGGSNRSVISQFVVEAVVLVAIAGVLGLGTAFMASGAVANALVSGNTASSQEAHDKGMAMAPGGKQVMRIGGPGKTLEDTADLVGKVTTSVGLSTIAYGFAGMIAIAIAGSAIPAWLIAKVRPAEVLRGE